MLDNQQVDAKTLTDQCLSLSLDAKMDLIRSLEASIAADRQKWMERRPAQLMMWMAEILGVSDIPTTRESRYTWARKMIAYQLCNDGFSVSATGRVMGKDHSTITYANKVMRNALEHPRMYQDVVDIWKQLQNRIEYETNRRTDQDPVCL